MGETKNKKLIIIGAIAVVVVGLMAMIATGVVVYLLTGGDLLGGFSKSDTEYCQVNSCFDVDGVAYVPLMNGEMYELYDSTAGAGISPDRKHIVEMTDKNEIYCTDLDASKEKYVASDVSYISEVYDTGFLYVLNNGHLHRYIYKGESDIDLGILDNWAVCRNTLDMVFSAENRIYRLDASSDTEEKISSIMNELGTLAISDDGKIIYWTDVAKYEELVIYEYSGDEKTKIGTIRGDDVDNYYVSIYENESSDYCVFEYSGTGDIFIKNKKSEPVKAKLGDRTSSKYIYTKNGVIGDDTSSKFTGMYISTYNDDEYQLFYIDDEGERDKVIKSIKGYEISNGYLYYLDSYGELMSAKLDGAELKDVKSIDYNVDTLIPKCKNGYLYYLKDTYKSDSMNYNTASLYVTKEGKDPVKISSDACYKYNLKYGEFSICNDGKTCFYIGDASNIGDSLAEGTLYKYTYGSSKSEEIDDEVLVDEMFSGLYGYMLENKSVVYAKYAYSKNDSDVVDYYYYDGKKGKVMAKDVFRQ